MQLCWLSSPVGWEEWTQVLSPPGVHSFPCLGPKPGPLTAFSRGSKSLVTEVVHKVSAVIFMTVWCK